MTLSVVLGNAEASSPRPFVFLFLPRLRRNHSNNACLFLPSRSP